MIGGLRGLVPGLALVAMLAVAARLVSGVLPATFSEVLVAVLLGIVVGNTLSLHPAVAPGVAFAVQRLLRLGIILLGARLSLDAVLATGASTLGLVVACMAMALAVALLLGRAVGVSPRLGLLIGVGTAVCGNSAILATAPVLRAESREVSFAMGTITLFGTLAVFAFPIVGLALGLGDAAFGVWSGIAVNDTSQVVAASSAFSPEARDVATVVKLVRNALMGPLIVLIAVWWRREGAAGSDTVRRGLLSSIPLFVLGFVALAALRSLGAIGQAEASALDAMARALILVALAGVGVSTRISQVRAVGLTPLCVGLGAATVLAALSLAAVVALGTVPAAGFGSL
jgi:uncharacterized integral membrane protein (TIGR00698 family)